MSRCDSLVFVLLPAAARAEAEGRVVIDDRRRRQRRVNEHPAHRVALEATQFLEAPT
jgi:hypothetical protein